MQELLFRAALIRGAEQDVKYLGSADNEGGVHHSRNECEYTCEVPVLLIVSVPRRQWNLEHGDAEQFVEGGEEVTHFQRPKTIAGVA